MKILLKIKDFIKNIFMGLVYLFIAMPIMVIAGYKQMKIVEKEMVKRKADEKSKQKPF